MRKKKREEKGVCLMGKEKGMGEKEGKGVRGNDKG